MYRVIAKGIWKRQPLKYSRRVCGPSPEVSSQGNGPHAATTDDYLCSAEHRSIRPVASTDRVNHVLVPEFTVSAGMPAGAASAEMTYSG
jgi:hypothetical protein